MTDDPEPERYYDWMLWKSRQDEKMAEKQLKLDLKVTTIRLYIVDTTKNCIRVCM